MMVGLRDLLTDESGQGMTEYILLVVIVAITVAGSMNLFERAVRKYYERATFWVALPIP